MQWPNDQNTFLWFLIYSVIIGYPKSDFLEAEFDYLEGIAGFEDYDFLQLMFF